MKLGTGPSFCCKLYICRNWIGSLNHILSCHRNDQFGINI